MLAFFLSLRVLTNLRVCYPVIGTPFMILELDKHRYISLGVMNTPFEDLDQKQILALIVDFCM